MTTRVGSRRLMSKSDLLTLLTPGKKDTPLTVSVVVERGHITLKSQERQRSLRKVSQIESNCGRSRSRAGAQHTYRCFHNYALQSALQSEKVLS